MGLKALDIFCGGGGACIGLQQAGFEVYGVDIEKHKNYPGYFIQGDIHALPVNVMDFDFIWASPPCQAFTSGLNCYGDNAKKFRDAHPNHIGLVRDILKPHPFTAIENVPEAPIRKDLLLTGPMVGLPLVRRKRIFELSFFAMSPPIIFEKREDVASGRFVTVTKSGSPNYQFIARRKKNGLPGAPRLLEKTRAMGVPDDIPFTHNEIGEAVPPPYARFIGEQVRAIIERKRHG